MVDPASALAVLQQVWPIVFKIGKFCKALWDAPDEFRILASEADSLQTCVKVLWYKECKALIRWLYYNRRAQYNDAGS